MSGINLETTQYIYIHANVYLSNDTLNSLIRRLCEEGILAVMYCSHTIIIYI